MPTPRPACRASAATVTIGGGDPAASAETVGDVVTSTTRVATFAVGPECPASVATGAAATVGTVAAAPMLVALRTFGSNAATGAVAPALPALAPACDPPVARERCLAGDEDGAARSSAESSIAPRLVTRPFALRSGCLSVTCIVASVVEKSDPAGAISWCDRLSAFGAIDGAVSAARTDGIGREWSKVGATATRPLSLPFVAPSCVPPARIAGGVESSA